jgi:hypothetical protein
MALLDNILGGDRRGGPSAITLGLLAILAYRTYQGKGRLAEMIGRSPQDGTAERDGRDRESQSRGGLEGLLGGLLGRQGSGGAGNLGD